VQIFTAPNAHEKTSPWKLKAFHTVFFPPYLTRGSSTPNPILFRGVSSGIINCRIASKIMCISSSCFSIFLSIWFNLLASSLWVESSSRNLTNALIIFMLIFTALSLFKTLVITQCLSPLTPSELGVVKDPLIGGRGLRDYRLGFFSFKSAASKDSLNFWRDALKSEFSTGFARTADPDILCFSLSVLRADSEPARACS